MTFFILCGLLIAGNTLARQHWNRYYFDVRKVDNTLLISFEVVDYDLGPAVENCYLNSLACEYSRDGVNFYPFMEVSTGDQINNGNRTRLDLSNKLRGAKIYFVNSFVPAPRTLWTEETNQRVEFTNKFDSYNRDKENTAWFSVAWSLKDEYKDVKYLRISGNWWVNGNMIDIIENEVYPIVKIVNTGANTPDTVDSIQNKGRGIVQDQLKNNEIKVSKHQNAVIVQGARAGEAIQVYATSGAQLQSINAKDDVVKIPLSTNQIYIVNVGQARHKLVL